MQIDLYASMPVIPASPEHVEGAKAGIQTYPRLLTIRWAISAQLKQEQLDSIGFLKLNSLSQMWKNTYIRARP
jgi:hypothetical protein